MVCYQEKDKGNIAFLMPRGLASDREGVFEIYCMMMGKGGGNIFVGSPGEIGELSGNYASTFVSGPCQDDVHIVL